MRVAIIGAGWAGCAAAVEAVRLGHTVTLFEAGRIAGGRARRIALANNAAALPLDNGQHILIGAYKDTLQLMQDVGVDPGSALLRMPLTLLSPDGKGLRLPARLPAPLDALVGIVGARGWSLADKASLLAIAARWQWQGFRCAPLATVADLCQGLRPRPMYELIDPLCVSALNTPASRASGTVFLRVLRDSLFSGRGSSNLLLPLLDLSALLPDAAIAWLVARGQSVQLGARVQLLERNSSAWRLRMAAASAADIDYETSPSLPPELPKNPTDTALFDHVILACPPREAARLVQPGIPMPTIEQDRLTHWQQLARGLRYEAITTVYLQTVPSARLTVPMLTLCSSVDAPAQFVFDRGALGGPPGLLALVISASNPAASAAELGQLVLHQARQQLIQAQWLESKPQLRLIQTITEKRATFACTPGLVRPPMQIVSGLSACGDYIDGPFPATLEGAVRSGLAAARGVS